MICKGNRKRNLRFLAVNSFRAQKGGPGLTMMPNARVLTGRMGQIVSVISLVYSFLPLFLPLSLCSSPSHPLFPQKFGFVFLFSLSHSF